MDTTAAVIESLERAAEIGGDPTAAVYARYFTVCPESRAIMGHVDLHMQGRMLTEVLRLMMAVDPAADSAYLRFETTNHTGYGVEQQMYAPLLTALRDTVRDTLGEEWQPRHAASWADRIDSLLAQLDAAQRSA